MRALDLGFSSIGILSPFHVRDWDSAMGMLPREAISAIELFLPYPRGIRPGAPCPFPLGSPSPDDKRDVVRYGTETILFADENGIRTVLVPPVRLDAELRQSQLRLRKKRNVRDVLASLRTARKSEAVARLDAFRSVLSRLLNVADRYGVRLVLIPGGWIDELPGAEEAAACLQEFRGAPLGIWLDILGRAVALEVDAISTWAALEADLAGATLSDHDEELNEVPLGEGSLNWEEARELLQKCPVWLVDSPRETAQGEGSKDIEFLEGLGRGPEKPGSLFAR